MTVQTIASKPLIRESVITILEHALVILDTSMTTADTVSLTRFFLKIDFIEALKEYQPVAWMFYRFFFIALYALYAVFTVILLVVTRHRRIF